MRFTINGQDHEIEADARTSLLDLLREHLHLTGTKKGCDQGACGGCTVLVAGERINSCFALAVQYEGREIPAIEGLGDGKLLRLQEALIECDGFQCRYYTPWQICSAVGVIGELKRKVPSAVTVDLATDEMAFTSDEIRERMSGNLCRCGAYNGIVAVNLCHSAPKAKYLGGDERTGRIMNPSLAEYHIPVHLDLLISKSSGSISPTRMRQWARRVSARSASPESARPWRTPLITLPANASARCRSRSISCSKTVEFRWISLAMNGLHPLAETLLTRCHRADARRNESSSTAAAIKRNWRRSDCSFPDPLRS